MIRTIIDRWLWFNGGPWAESSDSHVRYHSVHGLVFVGKVGA